MKPPETTPQTMPSDVAAAFARLPPEVQAPLMRLRELIFELAEALEVGPLTETLKWGEPAYLTDVSRAGTTIRLGCHRDHPGHYAAFFHCQTRVVSEIRAQQGETFSYQGKRGVFAAVDQPLDADAWRACFALALTYKRR
jgi:hypothetical protein